MYKHFTPPIFRTLKALAYIAFSVLLIITACKKNYSEDVGLTSEQKSKLSDWYRENIKVSEENTFSQLVPNWNEVFVSEQQGQIIHEIGLRNPKKLMVISEKGTKRNLDQEEKKHIIKLLIFQNKISGKILYAAYMSIENEKTTGFDKLHYKNLKNFSGTIYYHHFNGKLSNGWNYSEGKITEKITAITEQQFNQSQRQLHGDKKTEAMVCTSGYADKYQWQCLGVPGYENCGFTYVGQEYVTYCSYEEEDKDYLGNEDESGGGYFPPEYTDTDCAGKAGGTATWSNECNTCIGGTTGLTACPNLLKEIKVDSTARPCVDTIATAVISKAAEIQNVLSNLLSLANVNASAAISTMANSSTYKITIGEHLFNDQTKYNPDGSSYLIRKNGVTNDTTGFIYLNKLMLNDGTDLAVAATLIHELMHSYMVYGIHHTTGSEKDVFKNMNMFLFDQSGAPFSNQGVPQHIQMANTYVDSMAALLTSYAISRGILTSPDSSISLSEYCKDIFWQNLQHSQSYIAAPNKNRSASNGEREYKNTYNSTKKKKC